MAAHLDTWSMTWGLLGGVCLLMYSLGVMSRALRAALGDGLRSTIKMATRNRLVGFLTGTIVTALLTSATASSLLVVQFVQAGDMTFAQSLGVFLGINVGSTLNAHLIAYSLAQYALVMISVGYLASGFSMLPPLWRHVGEALFGLGLLFQSGSIISSGLAPLKAYPPFLDYLTRVGENPVLAMTISGIAAVVFQSSNTVIAVAIMLAQQGLLSLEAGVYFVLGANVGTCISAIFAAIGKRRETMRVAWAYLLLKVAGVAVLLPLLPYFISALTWLTTGARKRAEAAAYDRIIQQGHLDEHMQVHEKLAAWGAAEVLPVQIAYAHSGVNLFIALVCMPFLDSFAHLMAVLVPELRKRASDEVAEAGGAAPGGTASHRRAAAGGAQGLKSHSSDHEVTGSSSGTSRSPAGSKGLDDASDGGGGNGQGGTSAEVEDSEEAATKRLFHARRR